jgi:hypothetical protein
MLERFSTPATGPNLVANPVEEAGRQGRESRKSQRGQALKPVSAGFYMNPCRPSMRGVQQGDIDMTADALLGAGYAPFHGTTNLTNIDKLE